MCDREMRNARDHRGARILERIRLAGHTLLQPYVCAASAGHSTQDKAAVNQKLISD